MQNKDILQAIKNADDFVSKNKEKYEVITQFQKYLLHVDEDTYIQAIEYIEQHRNFFFKDHPSYIFFFYSIIEFCLCNFQNFEYILEICIHFSSEKSQANIRANSEELISISMNFSNSFNYFYLKKFFSVEEIMKKSIDFVLIFVNFFPEIEKIDREFAEKRKKILYSLNSPDVELIKKHFDIIQSDYSKHFENRKINYHPSPIHKAIREDDVDKFQSIVSKTNFNLNSTIENSFYERTKVKDDNLEPIKIAAIYKSTKIFKFLMMNNPTLDDDFLDYAFFGGDYEIIHLCENKCKFGDAYLQPIITINDELFNYVIENFSDKIKEKINDIQEIIQFFNENYKEALKISQTEHNENTYQKNEVFNILNSDCYLNSLFHHNYRIILNCLPMIIYILQYFDTMNKEDYDFDNDSTFLSNSIFDFDLFTFLYSQKFIEYRNLYSPTSLQAIISSASFNANDAFIFLYESNKDNFTFNFYDHLKNCIQYNSHCAKFILDILIEEKTNGSEKSNYNSYKNLFTFKDLEMAIQFYDEDVVVKFFQLFDLIKTNKNCDDLVDLLICYISSRMIISLFKRSAKFFSHQNLIIISDLFDKKNYKTVADFIREEYVNSHK